MSPSPNDTTRTTPGAGSPAPNGDWIEIAREEFGVILRTSTGPDTVAVFSTKAWEEFVAAVQAGKFDRLDPGLQQ